AGTKGAKRRKHSEVVCICTGDVGDHRYHRRNIRKLEWSDSYRCCCGGNHYIHHPAEKQSGFFFNKCRYISVGLRKQQSSAAFELESRRRCGAYCCAGFRITKYCGENGFERPAFPNSCRKGLG